MEWLQNFDIQKNWPIAALSLVVVILLGVIAFRGGDNVSGEAVLGTAQAMSGTMVAVQLTEIAASNPSPEPSNTPEPTTTPNTQPTNTPLPGPGACLSASLSDETIPDDTLLQPGENFTKGWVLTNTGNCTWTEEYALVFHHGDMMHAQEYTPLAGWVAPGESVTLTLDMIAPFEPGSHIGFWSLQHPDGTLFGPSATATFWVRVTIPGPTPTSIVRSLGVASGGSVRSDGQTDSQVRAGDHQTNLGMQGFTTYNFGNLSDESTVTAAILDINADYSIQGDPFGSMGCLQVYLSFYGGLDPSDYDNGSGAPLWTFCSVADFTSGASFGGSEAIQAVQTALTANQIQLNYRFENESDTDGVQDTIRMQPVLNVYWYK